MRTFNAAVAVLAALLVTAEAEAQERWAVEVRANGAVPTREVGSDELGTGFGFEGTVRYRFLPHLAGYAGWDWIRFTPDASFAGIDMHFVETGYAYGLHFEHPFRGESGPALWARGGGTYDHIEIEDANGDSIADSGHGLGWEGALGVALGAGSSWSFTPGVRLRSLRRGVEIAALTTSVDLRYVAVELGLTWRF